MNYSTWKCTAWSALLLGLSVYVFSQTAFAQVCSQTEEDAYRECLALNIASCSSEFPNCTQSRSVLTVAEIVARADELCCDKQKPKARRTCFRRQIRQFPKRSRNGEVKAFNREVLQNLRELRRTNCDTAYSDLF